MDVLTHGGMEVLVQESKKKRGDPKLPKKTNERNKTGFISLDYGNIV